MNYLKLLFAQIIGYRQRKCNESYKENNRNTKNKIREIK